MGLKMEKNTEVTTSITDINKLKEDNNKCTMDTIASMQASISDMAVKLEIFIQGDPGSTYRKPRYSKIQGTESSRDMLVASAKSDS